jgi:hypothetical protein
MSIRKCSFLRILRTTALTSLICFSSSAVYAMCDEDDPVYPSRGITYRTTCPNPYAEGPSSSASQRITYRTTKGSNPYGVHMRSLILFDLYGYDPTKPLEIKINHRTQGKESSPLIELFDNSTNEYFPIGKLPKSDCFTSTSYFVDLSPVYSYLLAYDKSKVLKLSFRSGVSDIHSVTLQQSGVDKKVPGIDRVISRKLLETLPEFPIFNERLIIPRVMTRPSFPDISSLILIPDPDILEALSQGGETQMVTFKRLMDKGDSFFERLNVAAAAARYVDNKEIALSLVGRLFLDKRNTHLQRLEIAAVAERIEKGLGILLMEEILLIEEKGLPFSDRLEIPPFLGEPSLFKFAKRYLTDTNLQEDFKDYI